MTAQFQECRACGIALNKTTRSLLATTLCRGCVLRAGGNPSAVTIPSAEQVEQVSCWIFDHSRSGVDHRATSLLTALGLAALVSRDVGIAIPVEAVIRALVESGITVTMLEVPTVLLVRATIIDPGRVQRLVAPAVEA